MWITILAFIGALGLLVLIHELGHFAVARLCGIKVLKFSLGFGPAIFRLRTAEGMVWQIAALPLGGYVSMLGEGDEVVTNQEDRRHAFNTQAVGKRMAVVIAGPLANLLLAVAILMGLGIYGTDELPSQIGAPSIGTPAQRAGLNAGDTVVAVEDRQVQSWEDLRWALLRKTFEQDRIELQVRHENNQLSSHFLDLTAVSRQQLDTNVLTAVGFAIPPPAAVIIRTVQNSAAEKAGLQAGDEVISINSQTVNNAADLVQWIKRNPGRELQLQVKREGVASLLTLILIPDTARIDNRVNLQYGKMGAEIGAPLRLSKIRYSPVEALTRALRHTYELSVFSLQAFGKMLTGKLSWRNLSGPVTIADYAGQTARLGLQYYLSFIAIVSISLGVLNLLPIPVLDGGHLLYYVYEFFRGKPLSAVAKQWGQRVGLGALLVMMSVAFFNDLYRLFS